MRSVFLWLKNTSKEEVAAWLDEWAHRYKPPSLPERWLYPTVSDPVLYIEIDDPYFGDMESDEIDEVTTALGGNPSVLVTADVSGRHDGTAETRFFAIQSLRRFEGVAGDDPSIHAWTVDEVEQDRGPNGRSFFDYKRPD